MYRRLVRRLLWAVTMDPLAAGLVCFLRPSSALLLTVAGPNWGRGAWGPVYFLRLAGCALVSRGGELRPTGIVGGSLRCLCHRWLVQPLRLSVRPRGPLLLRSRLFRRV